MRQNNSKQMSKALSPESRNLVDRRIQPISNARSFINIPHQYCNDRSFLRRGKAGHFIREYTLVNSTEQLELGLILAAAIAGAYWRSG